MDAWQREPGKQPVFKYRPAPYTYLQLPCGKCSGCRVERSRQWAMRCVYESSLYSDNCFLTLTYADSPVSLRPRDLVLFWKRLRKKLGVDSIRYFACGEYGEKLSRPHYHACVFGWRPADLVLHSVRDGVRLYKSDFLADVWGHGFVTVGDVTFESAAYVARYVMKKINLSDASPESLRDHYHAITEYGESIELHPEFVRMSRRPGIAREWYNQFHRDLEKDYLTMRGVKMRPPRFFDRILHESDPDTLAARKLVRKSKALQHADDNTPARLSVKRSIHERSINRLTRGLHHAIPSL